MDVSTVAKVAGFSVPLALTHAAYTRFVEWSMEDSLRQVHQDEAGRLWDVLYMARAAARSGESMLLYRFYCVPRGGRARKAQVSELKMMIGPGDVGEPVITILLPDED